MGQLGKDRYFQTQAGFGWAFQTCINKLISPLCNLVWFHDFCCPKQLFGLYYLELKSPVWHNSCAPHIQLLLLMNQEQVQFLFHRVISRVPLLLELREDEDKKYVSMNLHSNTNTPGRKLRYMLTPHKHWLFKFHFWHCKQFFLKMKKTHKQTKPQNLIYLMTIAAYNPTTLPSLCHFSGQSALQWPSPSPELKY